MKARGRRPPKTAPGESTRWSALESNAVFEGEYRICVASVGKDAKGGPFRLTVEPKFALSLSSPSGPGSLLMKIRDGGANHFAFVAVTLNAGAFPEGAFFGIDPNPAELAAEIAFGGVPFLVPLDAEGAFTWDPPASLRIPSAVFYAVALEFDVLGAHVGVTPPIAHFVP